MEAAFSLVLSLLLAQPPAPPPDIAADPIAASLAHLDAGRTAEAIALLEPVVTSDADNVPARFNLAIAYSMAGRDEESIAAFRKVLELAPKLVEAQMNLAQLLVKTGKHADAVPLLEQLVQAKEGDIRPVYLLARAYAARQMWKEAAPWFDKARALTPDDQSILLESAACYEQAGMKKEAIEAYRKSQEPGARERVGQLLLETGDLAGAATEFQDVMKRSPSPAAAFALATVHLKQKDPAKAIPLAAYIVEKEPSNADARLFLGRLLRDSKQYPAAAQQFHAATQLMPAMVDAWNELAGMLVLTKNYTAAVTALDKARELGGETPGNWWFRATALDSMHQFKPALESYQKFLAQSGGKFPDEEFKARQRVRILEREVRR
jgi:tetratricopeptide (TPR) repeat protein